MARLPELKTLIVDNELTVFTCHELIDELRDVLKRDKLKKYLHETEETYTDIHFDLTEFFTIEPRFEGSPDPKDNYLFDLALQHEAHYLVTGDKKLLAMESVDDVQIISLRTFEDLMSDIM